MLCSYCTHFHFFISRFREKRTASLRSWGWTDSSEMWWWFRICNKNHSLSFTFPILFSIEIHHFHQVSPFCHVDGRSIRAILTNPVETCDSLRQFTIVIKLWHRAGRDKRGRLRYVNPILCPTLCQLFAGCSCAPAHTQNPPVAGHRSWSPCHPHASHTIHSHVSSAHSHICSTPTAQASLYVALPPLPMCASQLRLTHIMVLGWDVDLEACNSFLSWIAQSHFWASKMRLRYSAQKCVPSFQVHISSQDHDMSH